MFDRPFHLSTWLGEGWAGESVEGAAQQRDALRHVMSTEAREIGEVMF